MYMHHHLISMYMHHHLISMYMHHHLISMYMHHHLISMYMHHHLISMHMHHHLISMYMHHHLISMYMHHHLISMYMCWLGSLARSAVHHHGRPLPSASALLNAPSPDQRMGCTLEMHPSNFARRVPQNCERARGCDGRGISYFLQSPIPCKGKKGSREEGV